MQTLIFVVGGPYFISRLSSALQPQRLPFVGGQIHIVLAAQMACGSRRPHRVGEVHPYFPTISFSISHLLLQSASVAARRCSCIGTVFLVVCQASTLINTKFSAGRSIEKGRKNNNQADQTLTNQNTQTGFVSLLFYVSQSYYSVFEMKLLCGKRRTS